MTVRAASAGTSELDDVLGRLSAVAETAEAIEQALADWVELARAQGGTWAQIGEALGVTRQSAWQRFSGHD